MRPSSKRLLYVWLLLMLVAGAQQVRAQLKADFTIDFPGGCSPLVATFTNTSTGTSAATTYQWNFGNGNSDGYTKDANAIYSTEKSYTVTLTIKDGAQTSSASKTVTVYKKPTVEFTFDKTKGCAPLPVTFTANATAGDGTITKYAWDFGDGSVDNGTGNTIAHTYNSAGTPPVSLTVVNSHGCLTTIDKPGPVILAELKAAFDASPTALCTVGETVNFTNKSTGPGTLSYAWDFGGGKTATTTNASSQYDTKGIFDVTLVATSSEGCKDTLKQPGLINVANFTTDFTMPATVCSNAPTEFTNKSTPAPNSTVWKIDELGGSYYGSGFTHTFMAPGTYHVTMTNTYGTCTESETKEIVVKNGPAVDGFLADLNGVCGAPVTVQFKDTSQSSVSWQWDFGTANASDTKKETSYTYNSNGTYYVRLSVADAQGCVNNVTKLLSLEKPNINIVTNSLNSGCPGLTMSFTTNVAASDIKSYEWIFGDGDTAKVANPTHVFNKTGVFTVTLKYTTNNDCVGTATYSSVYVYQKPVAGFSVNSMEICGSSPVIFTDLTTGNVGYWNWDFGDGTASGISSPTHHYNEAGEYTVTLVAGNGACADTIVKTALVKVLPPFPKANGFNLGCNKSGEVTFYQNNSTNAATKMWWDFGDGDTLVISPGAETTLHTYDSSKRYKVYLYAENGACIVKDSMLIDVLLRQKPVLEASLTEICGSGNLNIKISGLERSTAFPDDYYSQYSIAGWIYADGTPATPSVLNPQYPFVRNFSATLTNLVNGQSGIRVVVQSLTYPGCMDTSNLVPLIIKGPQAKFSYTQNNTCFKNPIIFKDQSVPDDGVPIKKWEWDFFDGNTYAHADTNYPANGQLYHQYAEPGYYYPVLTVTDEDGCIGKTEMYSNNYAVVKGPKASFSYSPDKVFPYTTVYFYNNTNSANSSPTYHWSFTNGTPGYNGAYPPAKTYTALGKDSITLIARDPSGCTDTAIQVLYIKDVAASFTYTENYISSASCPPVIINFTSTSENAQNLVWSFGTGGFDDRNRINTSHTYYKPGLYRVVLYAYGNSTYVDSSVQYITIKGPYAIITADTLSGCLNQQVTLNANVKNATSFTWDFGDGSLQQTTDTFAVHSYTKAGVFTPALVLKDGAGCSGTSELQDKIVIDSLAILHLQMNPAHICDSALVQFDPSVKSIALETLQRELSYRWEYGTGAPPAITTVNQSSHYYNQPGTYQVQLTVRSPYGCEKAIEDSVVVIPTPHGFIAGPPEICQDAKALFTATADLNQPITWQWSFSNGNTSTDQNPEAQLYNTPADPLLVSLVTENRGCADTTEHLLTVHKRPDVNLTPEDPVLCLGGSLQLNAEDGIIYSWRPVPGLNQYNIANPVASPTDNSVYYVEVTNAFGCKREDSTAILVAKPFDVRLVPDTFVCLGSAVMLPATGAYSYQWVDVVAGLNNTSLSAPVATPQISTTYTVVGYDNYNCFTDTAKVFVEVKALPLVKAPENMELPTGSVVNLPATTSNDVRRWNWAPADYLNCPVCPNPTSTPRSDITYTVTVTNQFGCQSSDTVAIKLVCAKDLVYIPNAFTPNNDGKNDVFYVKGRGIRAIKSMRVFNRWGEVVFETANVEIEDPSKGWDGMYKGREADGAAYVYYIELICDTGEVFARKGTIVLIR